MADTTKEVKTNGGVSGGTGEGSGRTEEGIRGNSGGSKRGSEGNSGNKSTKSEGSNGQATSDGKQDSGNSGLDGVQVRRDTRSVDGGSSGSSRGSEGSSGGHTGNTDNGNGSTASSENNEKIVSEKSTVLKKPKDIKPNKAAGKAKDGKKDSGDITDPETLSVILQSGFALLAGVIRRKHWNIEEDEALTIATPASTMIQKLTAAQKKKINQLTAPIVLGSAIASVVLPRLMIDLAMSKGAKANGNNKREVSEIQYRTSDEAIKQPGVSELKTNTDIPTPASTSNDREITDLFSGLDNGTGSGNIKI